MKRYSITIVSTAVLLCVIWYTDAVSARTMPDADRNMCCVGQWGSEPACAIAHDESRNLVFLGCRDYIYILDVSKPNTTMKISDFEHLASTLCELCFDYNTNRLYAIQGEQGVAIWDVSNAMKPTRLGHYDTPGYACALASKGSHVYVADGDRGLRVLDVYDPATPYEVACFEMTTACNVSLYDSYAYVADLGLRIVDISNPAVPKEVAYVETPGVARDIYVDGNYAYVADDWFGLIVFDITDVGKPEQISSFATCGYAWDIDGSGSNVYVATCDGGLRVIDVSNPQEPQETASRGTAYGALGVVATGQHVFVAESMAGLGIYSYEITRGSTARR